MAQEEKDLLLKDLCARLPYKVIVEIKSYGQETQKPWFGELSCKDLDCFLHDVAYKSVRPYLRPMSNMTEEEKNQWLWITNEGITEGMIDRCVDWLNKKMFDYRGLIPKGHAIAVTKDNNPYKD